MWSCHPNISPNRMLPETQKEGPCEPRQTPGPGSELDPFSHLFYVQFQKLWLLPPEGGDVCTTTSMYSMPQDCTPTNGSNVSFMLCILPHTHTSTFSKLWHLVSQPRAGRRQQKEEGNASHSEGSAQSQDGFAPNQNPVKSFPLPDLITPHKETTPRKNPRSVESHVGQKPLHTASKNVDRYSCGQESGG